MAKLAIRCKSSLQDGILQPIVYWVVGIFCIPLTVILFHYAVKYNFFKNSIITLVFSFIGLSVICSIVMIMVLMAILRSNFSLKLILPKAVEFSYAMNKLGLFDFYTQLSFMSVHKIRLFIADDPLLHDIQDKVRAKRYLSLGQRDLLSSHKGRRTLCLDAEEYERIAHNARTPLSVHESAVVAEKDAELAALRDELSRKAAALDTMTADYAALEKKFETLKSSDSTAPGRNKKIDNLHISRAPFWLPAASLIRRLHKDAIADTIYSKATIQAEFEREIEDYPVLKPMISDILATAKKIRDNTPFSLDGWAMDAICAVLRKYGVAIKDTPGPEAKNT